MLILASVLTSISITSTAIRIGVRIARHQLGLDDYFIGLAGILVIVQLVFKVLQVHSGYGQHKEFLSKGQFETTLKWMWASEFCLFFILPITKISICFFIFRIKSGGWLKRFLYAVMTGLILTHGACIIILLSQCRPFRAYWDRSAGTCWKSSIYSDTILVQVGKCIIRQ